MTARAEAIATSAGQTSISDAVARNRALLEGLQRLTESVSDELWSARLSEDSANTLGAQCRHLLDHYDSLLSGALTRSIDYGDRQRGRACERERGAARRRTADVLRELGELATALDTPLRILDDDGHQCASSLARELDFLASHSTHHLALMQLLARVHGVGVDPDLGVAASTRRYRAECARD